jgi:putative nucleotidyltransferase with HDIG domain
VQLAVTKRKNILEKVFNLGHQLGMEVYVVGGFVRDLYLGKEGSDIDFVVIGDAIQYAESFKKKYKSSEIVTYPQFGTTMLHYQNHKLEFVTARSEKYKSNSRKPIVKKSDLNSDLSRRDFTVNCLAMDISPDRFGTVIDIFDGLKDLKKRLIKTPLDPAVTFDDDPLRMLRAIRFSAVLQFNIHPDTYQAIIKYRDRLKIISQERITEELKKMLRADEPSIGITLLKETGILDLILNELTQLGGVEQRDDFHHKDVFDHTMQVLDNLSKMTDKLELRMVALYHDIAKPQTKRFMKGTGWTFHGHEDVGARMFGYIGRRLRLPVNQIKYIQKLIRLHLRPMQLVNETVTDSAIRRLMVDAGEELDDLMMLCRADITSKNPEKVKQYLANFDLVEEKMKLVEEKDNLRNFKLAIDGIVIMKTLNISPGPVVGQIKQTITDAVLDGEIPNESEACFQYLLQIKDRYNLN